MLVLIISQTMLGGSLQLEALPKLPSKEGKHNLYGTRYAFDDAAIKA